MSGNVSETVCVIHMSPNVSETVCESVSFLYMSMNKDGRLAAVFPVFDVCLFNLHLHDAGNNMSENNHGELLREKIASRQKKKKKKNEERQSLVLVDRVIRRLLVLLYY